MGAAGVLCFYKPPWTPWVHAKAREPLHCGPCGMQDTPIYLFNKSALCTKHITYPTLQL